ncbi:neural cell adhesion molecule 1-like [Oscarella lobularis]|uniref:neural cell adhesion molecule 1-like n=1 Tax=Oscarella lobularis TaxID=121494 RepID=UPI003313B75A
MVNSWLLSSVSLCMVMLLLKPSVLFAVFEFVDDPSHRVSSVWDGLPGYIFIPPDGHSDLIIVCSTNERSTIVWLSKSSAVPAILNITQTTDRKSVLYAKGVGDGGTNFAVRSALIGPSFTCAAVSSDRGERATTGAFRFALGVVPKLTFRPPPYVTAIEGEMVNFTCAYNSSIPPVQPRPIVWNRGSDASTFFANFRFYSTLSIQASRSNAGVIRCAASNIFGFVMATTTLIVYYAPTLLYAVSDYRFQVGAPFTVLLSVDAQPPASVILTKGTLVINSTSQSNVLYYTEAKARKAMAGRYNVTAINIIGTYRETFYITVEAPPDAPKVILASIGQRSAAYSWVLGFNGDSPITLLTFNCSDRKPHPYAPSQETFLSDDSQTSANITRLYPGVRYFCELYAINAAGTSSQSDTISFTTLRVPGAPAQPTNCDLVASSETSITFKFTMKDTGGREITAYSLSYRTRNGSFQNYPVTIGDGVTQQGGQVKVTGLESNVEYEFQLIATNSKGTSEPCSPTFKTTCKPFPPFLNKANMTHSFGLDMQIVFAIPSSNGCGRITDFKVLKTRQSIQKLESHFDMNNDTVTLFMTSLEAGRTYSVTVITVSEDGAESVASNSMSFAVPIIAGSESPSPTWAEAAPEDKSFSAGIITAIVVPVTLVVIVVLVSFIYVCIYRDIKVDNIKTDGKESPVYAEPDVSRPEENIQMKPSRLYETRKVVRMTSNSGYETTANL